jgi:hypothetical protein
MTESGQAPADAPNEDPTVVIFLGLYLLLLAFFILLNTISTFDEEKSEQAKDSVGAAFSEILPPALRAEEEMVSKGAVLELNSYQGQVQAALATILKLVETTSTGQGQLRVSTDVELLFDEKGENFNEDAIAFMDKISRVLRREQSGVRREVEIILGVGDILPEKVDAGSSQALRQVATFLHQLVERDVPPELISIGLSPGSEGGILMFFNPVSIDDNSSGGDSQ